MSAKHASPSPRTSSRAAKRAKGVSARCSDCDEWARRADEVAEREATLVVKEAELGERETATSIGEEKLAKQKEQLALVKRKLQEFKAELDERAAQLERESKRVTPPSAIRQRARRAKVEERMQLAVTLNSRSREELRVALSRMGKSYQDLNEGNGFLAAGELYGSIERFEEMFATNEKLTNITPVARLLDVIKNCKWRISNNESDESAEERSKTMLHAFRRRVRDRKTMMKVQAWMKNRNQHGLSEDDITALLYTELPNPDSDEEDAPSSAAVAAKFKPPTALPDVPDKLAIRDEKLGRKMQLADRFDEALDKDHFYHQHGKYNVLIGRALRTVCDAYAHRAGGMGRLDGSRFFFSLFRAGVSGKRKRADLSTVEEAAVLIAGLEDQIEEFARLVDLPEQMEDVCKLAKDAVELQTASVKEANAVTALKELLKELDQGKRHASVLSFIKKYSSDEVPMHKDSRAALKLLEKHVGDPIVDALYELSLVDLGETPDYQGKLKQALKRFCEAVELVYDADDVVLRPSERHAFVIASMLLWKRYKEVNKVDGAAELMVSTFATLGAILGKPGKHFPVWDPETGSDEHLFTWPQEKE